MKRERLENDQGLVCLAAIALGLITGLSLPGLSGFLDLLLWPLLGLLFFANKVGQHLYMKR